jgi:ribose-phosphate pyrophosphokinase
MQNNIVKIFAGNGSSVLAEKIAKQYGQSLSECVIQRFSDGEIQPNILESLRGASVFFIQSTPPPAENLLELLLLIDAAHRASAGYITAVLPYYGMARQDRKDKPRVSIGSKMVANILAKVGANRVITMDLHADQIQGFFDIPVDHLHASSVFIPYIKQLGLKNLVFAAPDVGGTKRARMYAKHFNVEMVICDKQRKRANEIESMTLIGEVTGKDVILIDDLCDTGGTLCNAAALMMDKGANSVRAFCTHPVLSGNAYHNIEKSVMTEMVVTDSIPLKQASSKLKVISVDEIFATTIRNVLESKSISSLFID